MADDAVRGELAGIQAEFLDETRELLEGLGRDLVALEQRPDDRDLVHRIFRAAHSLKGNAGFMGMDELATLAHSMESVLEKVRDGALEGSAQLLDLIFRALDCCRTLLAATGQGEAGAPARPGDLDELLARLEGLSSDTGAAAERERRGEPGSPPVGGSSLPREDQGGGASSVGARRAGEAASRSDAQRPSATGAAGERERTGEPGSGSDAQRPSATGAAGERERTGEPGSPPRSGGEVAVGESQGGGASSVGGASSFAPGRAGREGDTIRVSTARLDRLVNLVGELMANRSQAAALARRLRDRQLDDVSAGLSRLADQLQEEVLSIRMVQIRSLFQRFHRLVRDTARAAGREVVLELAGETTELDKAIVEAIHDPLVHLVRNAIAHGLEPPDARRRAGKPPAGRVRLAARHAEDHVVVEASDDGRGIDEGAVRRRAVEVGLVPAAEADTPLTAEGVRRLIFAAGFSTAAQVDRISGRGVGLDVVRTGIEALGGGVELLTKPGEGTTFTLRVPLTLAMIQIFLVRVGGQLYGLPLPHIDETIRVAPRDFQSVGPQRVLLLRGRAVPVVPLGAPFGLAASAARPNGAEHSEGSPTPLIVVRHGERRVGFLVDEVCGKDKTVLKPLGPYLARLPQPLRGIAGASLLGSGELVLIVDVVGLFALVADAAGAA